MKKGNDPKKSPKKLEKGKDSGELRKPSKLKPLKEKEKKSWKANLDEDEEDIEIDDDLKLDTNFDDDEDEDDAYFDDNF